MVIKEIGLLSSFQVAILNLGSLLAPLGQISGIFIPLYFVIDSLPLESHSSCSPRFSCSLPALSCSAARDWGTLQDSEPPWAWSLAATSETAIAEPRGGRPLRWWTQRHTEAQIWIWHSAEGIAFCSKNIHKSAITNTMLRLCFWRC